MPKGGYRPGAGGKPTWIHGKTKVIRVPEVLADQVLEIARALDAGEAQIEGILSKNEPVTGSKIVDLSGIAIRAFRSGPGVYLADLLRAGCEIRPPKLVQSIGLKKAQREGERAESLKHQVDAAIEDLRRLEGYEPVKDG